MYLLHKIRASEVKRWKKLEEYESFIGFFWNMAPGDVWFQNLKNAKIELTQRTMEAWRIFFSSKEA